MDSGLPKPRDYVKPKDSAKGKKITVTPASTPDIFRDSNGTMSISVPISIKRTSGRRSIRYPTGHIDHVEECSDVPLTPDQKSLARAFRWLKMLESNEAPTVADTAKNEGIDPSYVGRTIKNSLDYDRAISILLNSKI